MKHTELLGLWCAVALLGVTVMAWIIGPAIELHILD